MAPSLRRAGRWKRHRRRRRRRKKKFSADVGAAAADLIANDAGVQVSKGFLSCVEKGLTFIPSVGRGAKRRERDVKADLKRLKRTLNIRLHFSEYQGRGWKRSLISERLRSDWVPPSDRVSGDASWREFRRAAVNCAKVISSPKRHRVSILD